MLTKLRASYPIYNKAITFINVDWDEYGRHPVTTERNIPRRSTLVLIREGREVGRLVAQTGEQAIKSLLDKAL